MNPRSCFDELKRRNVLPAATFFRGQRVASGAGGNRSFSFIAALPAKYEPSRSNVSS